jgi:uncharacterized damage-inducible protein DinB
MVHHRAQVGVYLRLTGAAVPTLYDATDNTDNTGHG